MVDRKNAEDPYVGLDIAGYQLTEKLGEGRIGVVYKAVRSVFGDTLACKIIPQDKLKSGWERELTKVLQLRGIPHIIQYYSHGTHLDKKHRTFVWVLWEYIDGMNLKEFIHNNSIDMAFIENALDNILRALHACKSVEIKHGDLHAGNILISKPDDRLPRSPRKIVVSDFGYGGSHNNIDPKDDYKQLHSILMNLLRTLNKHKLSSRDKIMYDKLSNEFSRTLLETDKTQGHYVQNPEEMINVLDELKKSSELESSAASNKIMIQGPGDYLVAEALGNNVDEWKALFVPDFLASKELLSRNITVLTGARGCGKTMTFRRLTSLMDIIIGSPSALAEADQFVGFYVNCRDIIEAFPWVPKRITQYAEQQIIHFFHLLWFNEICKTIALFETDEPSSSDSIHWLEDFTSRIFGNLFRKSGVNILTHVRSFIENEKERCRSTKLGKKHGNDDWPLAKYDFLDSLHKELMVHISWIQKKPVFFFLDDYTTPTITKEVQAILNSVIFKRRSGLFFKISTEASNSFEKVGHNNKPLELSHDFELIDLSTVSLMQSKEDRMGFIDKIFRPRINRHTILHGKELGLIDILGRMEISNNELAKQMRTAVRGNKKIKTIYKGIDVFAGMWSSDIRTMIRMFTNMLREANGKLNDTNYIIDNTIQDKIYRNAGGEFMGYSKLVKNPYEFEKMPCKKDTVINYGVHLTDIMEAFIKVSRYEMIYGNFVKNQDLHHPKQAFRLEILDKFEPESSVLEYYDGLIRWHIFLQDWRGKSARGMITPRLYLNRILIPYSNLTFSSHDNIHLTNDEFNKLLKYPKEFPDYWKHKKKKNQQEPDLFME